MRKRQTERQRQRETDRYRDRETEAELRGRGGDKREEGGGRKAVGRTGRSCKGV